tara:strand:- start:388 stop:672 length:285 start_codon:yes stop_codon:yes gene_type:complete
LLIATLAMSLALALINSSPLPFINSPQLPFINSSSLPFINSSPFPFINSSQLPRIGVNTGDPSADPINSLGSRLVNSTPPRPPSLPDWFLRNLA